MKAQLRILICVAICFFPQLVAAQSAVTQPAENGIRLKIGGAHVELSAVTSKAFRLTVDYHPTPVPRQTIFINIDPKDSAVDWKPIHDGTWTGIESAAGQLLVDSASEQWTLKDSKGHTIIPSSPLAEYNELRDHTEMSWTISRPRDQAVYNYASGDVADALQQTQGSSHVGNGHTVIPYYWSPAGYAALLVGDNDELPASWSLDETLQNPTWHVIGLSADLYLIPSADLAQASRGYSQLTGRTPVPPRWTFGYLQSRFGWKDRAYIEDAEKNFLDRKLPVDAFIFDFEWYTRQLDYNFPATGASDFKDFEFNSQLFNEPEKQIADMHSKGIHVVGIRKPRLGNSNLIAQFRPKNWFIPGANSGTDARDLDFRNPDVRAWYADQMVPLLKVGIDGWWDDEGEQTFTDYTFWDMAEADALQRVRPGARLWTIDRAFQPGLARLGAAAWTGDIHGDWPTFQQIPAHLLNWSMAGMYYGACDIGGFWDEENPELLSRWMEAGVFFPVMRSHSTNGITPRFPWLFGPQAEDAIRKALDLRYRLIPMYYSLAHEAHDDGTPLMRPLVMEFPDDPKVANLSTQWLMGSGLMAAPILEPGGKRSVYLPNDKWYAFDSNQMSQGSKTIDVMASMDQIPVYVRAGTILPLAPIIQHTDELPGGPLELQIYPGKDATFTLVEDDGLTTGYLNGQIRRTTFSWNDAVRKLTWKIEGTYAGKDIFKSMNVVDFDSAGEISGNSALDGNGELTLGK